MSALPSPTQPVPALPVDQDAAGDPLPAVGALVSCRRRCDGTRLTGRVESNHGGLFLATSRGPAALAAALWDVVALPDPAGTHP